MRLRANGLQTPQSETFAVNQQILSVAGTHYHCMYLFRHLIGGGGLASTNTTDSGHQAAMADIFYQVLNTTTPLYFIYFPPRFTPHDVAVS